MNPDEVISEITQLLYDNKASAWTMQEKARVVAAVNISLQPRDSNAQDESDQGRET